MIAAHLPALQVVVPLFSATKTCPFGAKRTAVGFTSPEIATVSWNWSGRTTAPAPAGASRMARSEAAIERDATRMRTLSFTNFTTPGPLRGAVGRTRGRRGSGRDSGFRYANHTRTRAIC